MYGSADELGYEGPNPCRGVKKFKEASRDRYLQPGELRPFFAALAEEEPIWRDFFLLCLFTGARRGNVAAMRWDDIDIEGGLWRLPAEETKGAEPIVVSRRELALGFPCPIGRRPCRGPAQGVGACQEGVRAGGGRMNLTRQAGRSATATSSRTRRSSASFLDCSTRNLCWWDALL